MWIETKIRLIVFGLIFSFGFCFGYLHQVFVISFWPGVESFSGFIFFLGFGIWGSLFILSKFGATPLVLKPLVSHREWHPIALTKFILSAVSFVVILTFIVSVYLTDFLIESAYGLSGRFLMISMLWRVIVFLVPSIPAVFLGALFGIIIDLCFSLEINLKCKNYLQSDHPQFQTIIILFLIQIVISLSLGWYCSYSLFDHVLRSSALIFIPIIICLMVMLASAIETEQEKKLFRNIAGQSTQFYQSIPVSAGNPARMPPIILLTVGWLIPWCICHWSFAIRQRLVQISNFSEITSFSFLFFFAILAFSCGVISGFRINIKELFLKSLSKAERLGFFLSLFGVINILCAVFLMHVDLRSIPGTTATTSTTIIISILCFSLGIVLGLSIPVIAVGRPNRFDFWNELSSKSALGFSMSGLVILGWHYFEGNNLLAISFSSLTALAVGGITLIAHIEETDRIFRIVSIKRIHLLMLLFLYLGLTVIIFSVPRLKPFWLNFTGNSKLMVREGILGTVNADLSSSKKSLFYGGMDYSERCEKQFRSSIFSLIDLVIHFHSSTSKVKPRVLIINFPWFDDSKYDLLPALNLVQMDIDPTLRAVESRLQDNGPFHKQFKSVDDLYFSVPPYQLILLNLPSETTSVSFHRYIRPIIKRIRLAFGNDANLWIIGQAENESEFVIDGILLQDAPKKIFSRCELSLKGKNWIIVSSLDSIQRFVHFLEKED